MADINMHDINTSDEQIAQADLMDLFAEELPEQNDLIVPATTLGTASSASTGSCPFSTAGTLTTVSSWG